LSATPHPVVRARGVTLFELLVVALVVGVLLTLGAVGVRGFLARTEARSARGAVEQAIWGGATLASARGERIVLWRAGAALELRSVDGRTLRRFDVGSAALSLPDGASLIFTPPGVIDADSLAAWPATVTARVGDRVQVLDLSLIGEVRWR
jgi:type II secretory pathway pseudopilin PulG